MFDHIDHIRSRVEVAFQTILLVVGNGDFSKIDVDTMWKLIESCILPIILYACETWNVSKGDMKALDKIYEDILKRALKVPITTPSECLYIETGLLDLKGHMMRRSVGMKERIDKTSNDLLRNVLNLEVKNGWKEKVEHIIVNAERNPHTLSHTLKGKVKSLVKEELKNKILECLPTKSKVRHYCDNMARLEIGIRAEYMHKLSRNQACKIFKARSRMLKVKCNYKTKHKHNLKCRACGLVDETQLHVLSECCVLHPSLDAIVTMEELFSEDLDEVACVAARIGDIMKKLEDLGSDFV